MKTAPVAVTMVLLLSCGDDGAGGGDDDAPADVSCASAPLPLQNPRSFTLGETFYLPRVSDDARCGDAWSVRLQPAGSEARVIMDGAPEPRVTPDLPGSYRFELAAPAGPVVVDLVVVERSAAERFRNHYLTPLYGAALVGDDEIWTANGATYSVTRVRRQADGTWTVDEEIRTGSWPAAVAGHAGSALVYVAQRGSDSIGIVDRERGVLVDALWVGDEPTGLALSPDGQRLYVSLPTDGEVAVIDTATRAIAARVPLGFDPRALVLSPDGGRLYVAAYRSRSQGNDTMGSYSDGQEQDVWIVDTATFAVESTVAGVSADLRALALAPEGDRLYVAATDGHPVPSQADAAMRPFVHELVALDLGAAPAVASRADLTRQPGSGGPAVAPAGVAVDGDTVWVAAESSGLVLALDRATLAEKARFEVGRGARQLLVVAPGVVAVHCHASLELWIVSLEAGVLDTLSLAADARPPAIALGEHVFTRPGGDFATNHACASCHLEGQNEGMVWRFGPQAWSNVRPLQLLGATTPIGWDAYVSTVANFGYSGPASIIRRDVAPAEADGLTAFLASLLGAPRANSTTRVDGSYGEAALRGQELFLGKATCAMCHTPPLYTARELVEEGKSGLPADIPSLLGVYRHGVYFVKGQALGLDAALEVALAYVQIELSAGERADLLAFLRSLTVKGGAPLGMWPDIDTAVAVPPTIRPWIAFSEPIDDSQPGRDADAWAREQARLETADGMLVDTVASAAGGRVALAPVQPLAPGAYRFVVKAGLPFRSGGATEADHVVEFVVGAPAAAWPDGDLTLRATLGGPGGPSTLTHRIQRVEVDGAADVIVELSPQQFGQQQRQRLWLRTDGATVHLEPFAMPISPSGVGNARDIVGTVVSTAADGTIAEVTGTMRLTAPGFDIPNIPFTLVAADR